MALTCQKQLHMLVMQEPQELDKLSLAHVCSSTPPLCKPGQG